MLGQRHFPDNDRLGSFLRESIDRFMGRLNIPERTSDAHEDQVHYEEWVRFCLATWLVPDVLATACAVFDFDADILNERMPDLLERGLTLVPMDAAFISDVMTRLPDHRRMQIVVENLHRGLGDWTWAHEMRHAFDIALCQTLDIPDPPEGHDQWAGGVARDIA